MSIIDVIKRHPNIIDRKPISISELVMFVNKELNSNETVSAVSNVFKHKYYGINYKSLYRGVYIPAEKSFLEIIDSYKTSNYKNTFSTYWNETLARYLNISNQAIMKQDILIVGGYDMSLLDYFDHKDSPVKIIRCNNTMGINPQPTKEEFIEAKKLELILVNISIKKMRRLLEIRSEIEANSSSPIHNSSLDGFVDEPPVYENIFGKKEALFVKNDVYYKNLELVVMNNE